MPPFATPPRPHTVGFAGQTSPSSPISAVDWDADNSLWLSKPGSASGNLRPKKARPPSSAAGRSPESLAGSTAGGGSLASLSTPERRPGSGRFRQEELSCFKKIPTPSPKFRSLSGNFADWSPGVLGISSNGLRRGRSESGLAPPCAGRLRLPSSGFDSDDAGDRREDVRRQVSTLADSSPAAAHRLPLEEKTATVLELIFPRVKNPPSTPPASPPGMSSPARESARDREGTGHAIGRSPSTRNIMRRAVSSRARQTSADANEKNGHADSAAGGVENARSVSPGAKAKATGAQRLLMFRQKILDSFQTVKGAFANFATEKGHKEELSKKQFCRFLANHFPGLSREEQEEVFDFLDVDKNGNISMHEFHTAIEASAPVKTIEDLRRKWIALGFSSMRSAIQAMSNPRDPERRLNLQDFSSALARVGVENEIEHQCVFNAICDPYDTRGTVSLEQLSSAIAAVSPSLLLEEIWAVSVKKYGDVSVCFAAVDPQRGEGEIGHSHFMRFFCEQHKLSALEARKAFDFIDIDSSGKIDRDEFISALSLSEPSFLHEDLRKKIRQRFRSIAETFQQKKNEEEDNPTRPHAETRSSIDEYPQMQPQVTQTRSRTSCQSSYIPPPKEEVQHVARRTMRTETMESSWSQTLSQGPRSGRQRLSDGCLTIAAFHIDANDLEDGEPEDEGNDCAVFGSMLRAVQLTDQETQVLFDLVDIDGNGRVTNDEFQRGVHLFAPACVLEDLRLHLIKNHGGVFSAFKNFPQERREVLMDVKGLAELLRELGVPSTVCKVDKVFSLCESRPTGGLTLAELTSALQAASPGAQVPLSDEQRGMKVRSQVRWQLAPFTKSAKELRGALRTAHFPLTEEELHLQQASAAAKAAPVASEKGRRMKVVNHTKTHQSYARFSEHIGDYPEEITYAKVSGYYMVAGSKLTNDEETFTRSTRTRHAQHASFVKHRRYLARDAPPMCI
eukprot:TRINITY_DN15783_c0_g2_i1.p1 TRINITY_DN15783_c0_g2~~TRINITY_DN15783_c0_g2_i1.p1  ORF type:complete len:962 (+),score=140.67 TRINITY_DN15783_c0_g2_i1:202-3087(+)